MSASAPTASRLPAGPGPGAAARTATLTAVLVGLTTGLIVLGALVRAHGAGLACPDWPLCFGEVVPSFDLKVAFEWGHRAIAGSISLLFLALAVAILRRPELRARSGLPLAVAGVLLGVQVLLGALTVWHLLARWTVTSHLIVGNSFNACLLWLVLRLRDQAQPHERAVVAAGTRAAVSLCAALLLGQMVLGGLVSSGFAGLVCPEWPTCLDGVWYPTLQGPIAIHLAHRTNGYLLLAALLLAAVLSRGAGRLARLCAGAAALCCAQVAVGVANVLLEIPVELTGLHSALAALLVLCVAAALYEAWSEPRPRTGAAPA